MPLEIIKANYADSQHQKDIPILLNKYASCSMGGGIPLDQRVIDNLVNELSKREFAFSILCYNEGKAIGLVNCFEAFSTFACKPLINIHDVFVAEEYRGLGISQKMIAKVEEIAREKECCKLTLEVLSENKNAQMAYLKLGFTSFEIDPKTGSAAFWQKKL